MIVALPALSSTGEELSNDGSNDAATVRVPPSGIVIESGFRTRFAFLYTRTSASKLTANRAGSVTVMVVIPMAFDGNWRAVRRWVKTTNDGTSRTPGFDDVRFTVIGAAGSLSRVTNSDAVEPSGSFCVVGLKPR